VVIEHEGRVLLIDAGPDFRSQALNHGLSRVDAVLLTHAHADHVLGLDDLRPLSWERPIPLAGDQSTLLQVERVFPYFFGEYSGKSSRPQVSLFELQPGRKFELAGLEVVPLTLLHGDDAILGFRIGSLAYLTDCNGIPDESLAALTNLEVLILGVLRYRPHPTHFHLEDGLAMAALIGARRTYLTHLGHDFDHEILSAELPAGVSPAFDGLSLTFQ
jgi:phosphoribosyl 1,2-cyclic phosphate phosphodiesterase